MIPIAACRKAAAPVPVHVVAMPYLYMASLYLADELGHFAKEGLHVDIEQMEGSTVAIPVLAGGKADAAFFGIHPALINAVARGARIRIVAGRQFYSTDCPSSRRLFGSRHAFPNGFTDLSQIKGKTVSVGRNKNGMTAFVLSQAVAAAKLTDDDFKLVSTTDAAGAAMLVSDKIDVIIPSNDYDLGLTPLKDRVVPGPTVASFLPNYMYSYTMFGKRFLDEAPQEGVRFLKAFFQGGRDYLAGKTPKFIEDVIQKNGFDPNLVRQACREGLAADGRIQYGDIQRFIDWCVERKLTPDPLRAEQMVDTRFLDQARGV
jgi:NitT/TauT family transport system substrate-binding protein